MNKKQFLDSLYQNLSVGLNKEEIYSHIQYYDEYIENEKMKGVSEEEVIKKLGNPRLLAKTILGVGSKSDNAYQESSDNYTKTTEGGGKKSVGSTVKFWVITIIVVFLLIQLMRFAWFIFVRIALPIIVVVMAYRFIKKLFR